MLVLYRLISISPVLWSKVYFIDALIFSCDNVVRNHVVEVDTIHVAGKLFSRYQYFFIATHRDVA